jgi:hypothetical protein
MIRLLEAQDKTNKELEKLNIYLNDEGYFHRECLCETKQEHKTSLFYCIEGRMNWFKDLAINTKTKKIIILFSKNENVNEKLMELLENYKAECIQQIIDIIGYNNIIDLDTEYKIIKKLQAELKTK